MYGYKAPQDGAVGAAASVVLNAWRGGRWKRRREGRRRGSGRASDIITASAAMWARRLGQKENNLDPERRDPHLQIYF